MDRQREIQIQGQTQIVKKKHEYTQIHIRT